MHVMLTGRGPKNQNVLISFGGPGGFRISRVSRAGDVTALHVSDGDAIMQPLRSPDGRQLAWTRNRYQCVPWTFQLADR